MYSEIDSTILTAAAQRDALTIYKVFLRKTLLIKSSMEWSTMEVITSQSALIVRRALQTQLHQHLEDLLYYENTC